MSIPTAIMTKFTELTGGANNDFYIDIQGRLTRGQAESAVYPRADFWPVSDLPEYPGGKTIEEGLWQFDLYSASSSYIEIEKMLTDLRALYDDCSLTITGQTLISFIRGNFTEVFDGATVITDEGTTGVKHYVQEYELKTVN